MFCAGTQSTKCLFTAPDYSLCCFILAKSCFGDLLHYQHNCRCCDKNNVLCCHTVESSDYLDCLQYSLPTECTQFRCSAGPDWPQSPIRPSSIQTGKGTLADFSHSRSNILQQGLNSGLLVTCCLLSLQSAFQQHSPPRLLPRRQRRTGRT